MACICDSQKSVVIGVLIVVIVIVLFFVVDGVVDVNPAVDPLRFIPATARRAFQPVAMDMANCSRLLAVVMAADHG